MTKKEIALDLLKRATGPISPYGFMSLMDCSRQEVDLIMSEFFRQGLIEASIDGVILKKSKEEPRGIVSQLPQPHGEI